MIHILWKVNTLEETIQKGSCPMKLTRQLERTGFLPVIFQNMKKKHN